MAMLVGDAKSGTGLAGRIYSTLTTDPNAGFSSVLTAAQSNAVAAICNAIAAGVVAEIQANATVTIKATDTGLQTSTAAGSATGGPSLNKTLSGGCIG